MNHTHEPRGEFVERLEGRIASEARRRLQAAPASLWTRWIPQRPIHAALAVVALIAVSMSIGGFVVAAAYEAQTSERRDLLVSSYQQRVNLAKERLALATTQLRTMQQRVSTGLDTPDALLEAQFKVKEAEAQVQSIELQLREVMTTGLEPLNEVSAPPVSGRDFVTERWRIEMTIPMSALQWEKVRLTEAQRRFAVGMASSADLDLARSRIVELETAIDALQKKMAIRQQFLRKELDAELAVLRVLEAEAEQRATALAPRIELARKQLKDMMTRVQIGTATAIELSEVQIRVKELELDLTKAQMELNIVRQRIQQHRVEG